MGLLVIALCVHCLLLMLFRPFILTVIIGIQQHTSIDGFLVAAVSCGQFEHFRQQFYLFLLILSVSPCMKALCPVQESHPRSGCLIQGWLLHFQCSFLLMHTLRPRRSWSFHPRGRADGNSRSLAFFWSSSRHRRHMGSQSADGRVLSFCLPSLSLCL